ncbi:hypothetical protein [Nocardia wallacei]|nr:hypothetical protein [Nocardia wallacei]
MHEIIVTALGFITGLYIADGKPLVSIQHQYHPNPPAEHRPQ